MPLRNSSTRLFLSLLAGFVCLLSSANAGVSIESVEVGIGQVTRPGVWTQLKVQLQSTEAVDCHVEVVAADPTGNPATFPSAAFELQPQAPGSASLFFMTGRLEDTILVKLVSADGKILASKRLVSAEARSDLTNFTVVRHAVPVWLLAGKVGSSEKGKSTQQTLQKLFAARGVHISHLDSTNDFPDHWRAFSAVDTIFLAGSFDLTKAQSSALNHWVQQGGHAVIVAGTRVEQLAASPIAEWVLSDREVIASSLSDLSGLEAFAKSSFRIPIVSRIKGSIIRAQDGIDAVTGIEGPLLTRSAHGFGRISLLGVDVDQPPLSRWRALDSFIVAVADLPATDSGEEATGQRISHSGITELATQFQIGMEAIPHVGDRSTLTVLGLVLLFLLVIGPLDYLLVHRLLKKPGLTWITFPSIVIAAGLLAGSVAGGANGKDVRSRMCELIDVDSSSGFVRKTAWTSVYSPEHRRYRIQIEHDLDALASKRPASPTVAELTVDPTAAAGWLRWTASPESNFGGTYRASGLNSGGAGYKFFEELSGIENLPIPAASDRILASSTTFSVSPEMFELNLKQAGTGHLSRESTFTHHLPGPIDNWLLVYGNRAYFFDHRGGELLGNSAIEPGAVWAATGKTTGGRELRSFLTGSSFQKTGRKGAAGDAAEFAYAQVEWNRRETDLQTILRMVTFHQFAGGSDYTGLFNHALSDLEMSDSLPLDRAVLIGELSLPAATVQIDGQTLQLDQQETFIRVLLRVEDAPIALTLPKFEN
jgi:hypothetical protein